MAYNLWYIINPYKPPTTVRDISINQRHVHLMCVSCASAALGRCWLHRARRWVWPPWHPRRCCDVCWWPEPLARCPLGVFGEFSVSRKSKGIHRLHMSLMIWMGYEWEYDWIFVWEIWRIGCSLRIHGISKWEECGSMIWFNKGNEIFPNSVATHWKGSYGHS